MRHKFNAAIYPVGRLHDPLDSLAENVHRFLTFGRRAVSVDEKGRVFVEDANLFDSVANRSIVGTYDVFTLIPTIESDLRRALRERASRWIIDWNAPIDLYMHRPAGRLAIPEKRRRRIAAGVDGKRVRHRPAIANGLADL